MERLTLKIKKQLAFLMVGVLFFNSTPMLNLLVYAQEDGFTTVSGGDVSGGDVSGGDVSGGDVSGGDVSGGDSNNTPPEVTGVIYTGLSRVETAQGDVVEITEGSGNKIDETMHAFAREEVKLSYQLTVENADDMQYIKVFHVTKGISEEITGAVWNNSENNTKEWNTSVSVSGQGKHRIVVEYQKDDISVKNSSATIYIDDTEAKLNKVKYSVSSGDLVEIVPEGDLLEGDGITRYYNENVKVEFELAENFFYETDLKVSDSYYEGSDKTLQYSTSTENGVTKVICEILAEDEGTHELCFNYYDKIYDKNVSYKTKIIIDTTPAEKGVVEYTDWTSAWSENDDEEILQYVGGTRDDVILYHKDSMTLTFEIEEKHFQEEDVDFSDFCNGKKNNIVLNWQLVDAEKNLWQAQYTISEKGDHKVSLSYQDRSGNEPPIEYVSERIVLDDTSPVLSDVTITPCAQEVEDKLYYSDKVDITFTIEEENFNEGDVVLRDNGTEMAATLTWEQVTGENSNLWTATYNIPKEKAGEHIVALEYGDRSGNDPIKYASKTIIIDSQKSEIILGNNESKPDETGEKKIIYLGEGQKLRLYIKEENFRAADVDATVSVGGVAAEEIEEEIDAQIQDPSNWTKVPDRYVSYIDLDIVGEYDITFNCTDLAKNAAEEESALIIFDKEPPKVVDASYDKDLCKRMVDRNNETVTTADVDTRYIYQDPMTFKLTIEEEHFDAELAEVSVYRDGIKLENNDGYNVSWTTADANLHHHTLSVGLGEKDEKVLDGDYRVIVGCKDPAPNSMESYISNVITIDKTNPEIAVDYDNENAKNGTYYNKERVATITVTDRNVVPGEIKVSVTGKDIDDNILPYDLDVKQSPWSPGKEQGTWISTITYDMEANYEFEIECMDMAGNYRYGYDRFTIDKTKPDKGSFKIEYSTPIMETPEGTSQNSFYKDSVTVRITAKDRISPIDSFEWTYKKQPGASPVNQESETQVINNKDVEFTYDAAEGTATAEFTLTADQAKQYRGNIRFKATDMAGNTSGELADSERVVIVDNISPGRTVEYSPASQVVNKDTLDTLEDFDYASENAGAVLFYDAPMTITFRVSEANFYADDIVIRVNGTAKSVTDWSRDGDVRTGSLEIAEDGEYTVTLQYTDRSTNKMVDYVSHKIIVDTIKPKIHVDYSPGDAKQVMAGTKYYDKVQTATITIEERNFRADDVEAVVKATDINGNRIDVQDFAAYLKNRSNWVTQGDKHTAKITFEKDANYEFDIDFKDLASTPADDYSKDVFTVDQTAPDKESFKIEYSTPVMEAPEGTSQNSFYKDSVTVKITAKDRISPIDSFEWTYKRQPGASPVNQESEMQVINSRDVEFTYDAAEGTATAEFTLTADQAKQYRGNICFKATDMAGNTSGELADSERTVIVDNISPGRTVEYSPAIQVVNKDTLDTLDNFDYASENAGAVLFYDAPMTITIRVSEANFYADDIVIRVNGTAKSVTDWSRDGDVRTGSLEIAEDGEYTVTLQYTDRSTNKMVDYVSHKIIVDTINPQIHVDYSPGMQSQVMAGIKYYDKVQTATITIEERNFRADDVEAVVKATDINGNKIDVQDFAAYLRNRDNWVTQGDKHTAKITFEKDANYKFEIKCRDMAANHGYESDRVTVDKTAPDKESFKIEYSTPVMEVPEGTSQSSFYKDSVTVRITARDRISPIDSFEWTYKRQPGASPVNQESEMQVINNKDVEFTYDAAEGTATAEFTLTADQAKQYRGNIRFKATDMAGNTSEELADSERVVIVDNISPGRTVEYSPASQVVNKDTLDTLDGFDYASEDAGAVLFYDAPMTITFRVSEANFYADDIVVRVNGTAKSVTDWSGDGDVRTGSLEIAEDGEYTVTLQYTDRSTNKMVDYVSHRIIVDTIKPKIHVDYSPGDAKQVMDGIKYYDKVQTATITIEERNFRADDVEAVVKATDINGNRIDVQDFAAYLKNRSNWVTQGDKHTAKITFEKDANYEFDIDFKDLASTPADDYPKNVFTVDKTAPTNVKVSFSSPVSQRTILGTEYEFYKNPIVVTITAEDEVSGVYSFDYSYVRAGGVSSVNSENINNKVEIQDIKYSDGRKTATATFVIPASALRSGTQINGNMEFAANNRSMLTTEYKDSRRYVVDNIVPNVTVELNESVQKMNDVSYYAENINVTVSVDEANFYKEDVKVSISKDGGEQYAAGVSWRTISTDRHIGSITLVEEGNYKVYVSYQDPSTNKIEDYESNLLIIDKTQPSVSVAGIKHNSANKQEQIGLSVTVEDTNLNTDSFQPKLLAEIRDESGNIRQVDCTELGTIETVTVGKSYTYTIPNINQDGIYQLSCLVSDMSGNATDNMVIEDSNQQATMQLNYSVNRNGSTYSLGEGTKKLINRFVKKAVDVVVYETNPDEISNIKITLFKNDETIILEEGKDYTVNRVSDDGDWYKYEYTIYDTNFEDDGTYRISIYSEDKAGNIAENNLDVKDVEISFGVDKTLPNLIVTNLESETTYPVDKLSVLMRATDNMKLQDISVELDGKEIASWDEEQIQEMSNNLQDFVFDILGDETSAHTLIITLTDIAGNQRIESISDFYVTRNLWVRFINNKILFYGSIITCLTTGLVIILLVRRKKKH